MSLSANEVAGAAARSRPYLAVALGIVALTLIAYAPIYWNDFIFLDDSDYILTNPPIAKGLTPETIRWAWTTNHHGYYHPLTWMSLLADVSLFGYHPWGMHLTNLLLHIATSVGLFLVFVRMTDEFWPSAVLAALFAVHPMHVESVAWAAERKDVLSTFFLVLTLASYTATARRPNLAGQVRTSALFTLGLLAKPMLVTLPFGLLLLDVWPLRRTNLTGATDVQAGGQRFPKRSWIELVAEKLPLFALAFAFSLVTFRLQKDVGAVMPLDRLQWQPRIGTVLKGYVWYVETTLLPTALAVFHSHRMEIPVTEMVLPALLLVGITIVFLLLFRKHPELLIGWLWFGGTLFPVSGIAQSGAQAHADRFAYVPHIGLFIVLIWGGTILIRRWHVGPTRVTGVVAVVLLLCTGLTFRQVGLWRNTETLFLHALAVTSNNNWAHSLLGEYYSTQDRLDDAARELEASLKIDQRTRQVFDDLSQVEIRRGHFADAEKAVRASLKLEPKDIETQHRLAYVLFAQQKTEEAGDILERVLALFPRRPDSQELLGQVRASQRRYDDAIAHLTVAIEVWPDYAAAHHQLAGVYLLRNELPLAEKHFAEAIRGHRHYPSAWSGLFRSVLRQDRTQDAFRIADDAVKEFPREPVFRGMRALALDRLGRRNEARNDYDELERIVPGWAKDEANTALRSATLPDDLSPEETLEHAEQAVWSTEFRDVRALEALAAAQASLGRFEAAIVTIDRALALPMLPPMLRDRLREDRASFVRREPLRERAIEPEPPKDR